MGAVNPLIAAATAAATSTLNATEADKVFICINTNALGVGETVTVNVVDSAGTARALSYPGVNNIGLSQQVSALMLEGGCIYSFTKSATAASVGVDYAVKPRIGN